MSDAQVNLGPNDRVATADGAWRFSSCWGSSVDAINGCRTVSHLVQDNQRINGGIDSLGSSFVHNQLPNRSGSQSVDSG